ncbi:MAG: N-acetylmuramoyl-L-alanine amidase [Bdellovibrio sp. CG12_big_fil_rev_8_21_14_0_65_39_13]|nr:MAG: N-acetylmuramoyl-L-alanine amidase [Bdellovibrio sp. CG22_combo_CG10-13_8_21_14_all_39_27]PIQ58522.1 MAG: N-acetylmuramoyl-L-alanine amidase [Bdellovibrio sp. CG12_big_fil_rev_8_21_14_0_65_39_13]PIR35474.1 MAG: N-acetylmuramoyl-L-alanine amidase [Bdellovibrio sp. CG11_big_fil_rev_8_21_14_0_20_39_38]
MKAREFYKIILITILFSAKAFGFTVLIDPGHGGDDLGAVGQIEVGPRKKEVAVYEKDVSLDLSKRILLELKGKGIKGFLSRSIDRTVSLADRAQMAEKIKADLYISVHLNASTQKEPRGFETYYLDNHQDAAVRKVEEAENKDLSGEALIVNQILTDLVIDKTVETSKGLALKIHNQIHADIGKSFGLVNRGIKPGLFYVLALAKRPAILLEVGFISNEKELKRLMTKEFQRRYAKAVAKGIADYLKKKSNATLPLF